MGGVSPNLKEKIQRAEELETEDRGRDGERERESEEREGQKREGAERGEGGGIERLRAG